MKTISMPHKVCDYTCPINGLEDLYEWKTGQRLPDFLLFYLSSIGFAYIKQSHALTPRMVFWGSGIGKRQYDFLTDIVGFTWECVEGISFNNALRQTKHHIDEGEPVLLGLLDMYHLPYFQTFYHQVHIPEHFVLMVGYDDDAAVILVQDNSRQEIQNVPYVDLKEAWNINIPGRGKKNTFYVFRFQEKVARLDDIVHHGLHKRATAVLNPHIGFTGIRGMRKLAREIPQWLTELSEDQLNACLKHLVTFTCSVVPMLPARLLPYPTNIQDNHSAARDHFADLLTGLAAEYQHPSWKKAGKHFCASSRCIAEITELACDLLLHKRTDFGEMPALLNACADEEEKAFRILLDCS